MYDKAAAGEGVIVADNFSQLHDLTLGDTVEIPAPYGMLRLPIVGIIVDFVDQQGTVFVDRSVFLQYWQDDTVSDFRVFLEPGTNVADVRQRIIDRFTGERHVFVLTNEEARQYVLRIADQWFSLMNVQIGIAVLVAILGIVNTLTVSITDRRRELGVLKAVGAQRRQIRGAIWLEAASVAVIGLVLGGVLGADQLVLPPRNRTARCGRPASRLPVSNLEQCSRSFRSCSPLLSSRLSGLPKQRHGVLLWRRWPMNKTILMLLDNRGAPHMRARIRHATQRPQTTHSRLSTRRSGA